MFILNPLLFLLLIYKYLDYVRYSSIKCDLKHRQVQMNIMTRNFQSSFISIYLIHEFG